MDNKLADKVYVLQYGVLYPEDTYNVGFAYTEEDAKRWVKNQRRISDAGYEELKLIGYNKSDIRAKALKKLSKEEREALGIKE